MVPLNDLKEGDIGEIIEISEPEVGLKNFGECHRRRCHHRVSDIGLRKGKIVQILRKQKRGGMLLKVDDSRIVIDQGLAGCIQIKSTA